MMLSTKLCCADNDCQDKVANKIAHSQKAPAKEKDCPGCSPFFTCGSCVGFIIAQSLNVTRPAIKLVRTKYGNVYKQPDIKKVALSIWLPPKIS